MKLELILNTQYVIVLERVFCLRPVLFHYRESGTRALSSACKTHRDDLPDWILDITAFQWQGNPEKKIIYE